MKKFVLDKCMNIIKTNKDYDDVKLAEIKYGLEAVYLTITKIVIIAIVCAILGIFKEFLIFTGIYTLIRATSFGIHASKSWVCLLASSIEFIGIPFLCLNIRINFFIKILIGIAAIIGIYLFSPADTHKKPIVNKTRRKIYKILSTIIAFTYILLSVIVKNFYLSNCFFCSIILQNILISPITYKLFNMPYNNYKAYILMHGLNE